MPILLGQWGDTNLLRQRVRDTEQPKNGNKPKYRCVSFKAFTTLVFRFANSSSWVKWDPTLTMGGWQADDTNTDTDTVSSIISGLRFHPDPGTLVVLLQSFGTNSIKLILSWWFFNQSLSTWYLYMAQLLHHARNMRTILLRKFYTNIIKITLVMV